MTQCQIDYRLHRSSSSALPALGSRSAVERNFGRRTLSKFFGLGTSLSGDLAELVYFGAARSVADLCRNAVCNTIREEDLSELPPIGRKTSRCNQTSIEFYRFTVPSSLDSIGREVNGSFRRCDGPIEWKFHRFSRREFHRYPHRGEANAEVLSLSTYSAMKFNDFPSTGPRPQG